MATFASKLDWERYWFGDDFGAWRADFSSFYQVPVVYTWNELTIQGALDPEAAEAP